MEEMGNFEPAKASLSRIFELNYKGRERTGQESFIFKMAFLLKQTSKLLKKILNKLGIMMGRYLYFNQVGKPHLSVIICFLIGGL